MLQCIAISHWLGANDPWICSNCIFVTLTHYRYNNTTVLCCYNMSVFHKIPTINTPSFQVWFKFCLSHWSAIYNIMILTHWPLGVAAEILNEQFFRLISMWNCSQVNATRPHWWLVNIGSGNGLVPSGNTPLPEPILTQRVNLLEWHPAMLCNTLSHLLDAVWILYIGALW